MGVINLTKEGFSNLKIPIFVNGETPIGGEGSIRLYNGVNGQTKALKIFNLWNTKNEKIRSVMNIRREKISCFSKMDDIDVIALANDTVLIESVFSGLSMRYFDDPYSLYNDDYLMGKDLSFAVRNAKRLQDGIRYEGHERGIYTRDMTPGNIIFFDDKAYLIDTNGYIIKALEPKTFNEEQAIKEDMIRIIQAFVKLITGRYAAPTVTMDIINNIILERTIQYF